MNRIAAIALILGLQSLVAAKAEWTFPLDPVELIGGREVAGRADLSVERGRFRYEFASEASRDRFLAAPDRYEIQFGGGCARMGPLSGAGETDIFHVFDERIYIFASDACRETFRASPTRFLDFRDPVIGATPEGIAAGNELVQRAILAMGGAARVDAVRSYRDQSVRHVSDGELGLVPLTKTRTMRFADGAARHEMQWGDKERWGAAVLGGEGIQFSGDETWPLVEGQRLEFGRLFGHDPFVILRNRDWPDFMAVDAGPDEVDGRPVDRVRVFLGGMSTVFGVDRETGRILSSRHRGRGADARIGTLKLFYSDFRPVNGIELPFRATATFDGEPYEKGGFERTSIEIDPPTDDVQFAIGALDDAPPTFVSEATALAGLTETSVAHAFLAAVGDLPAGDARTIYRERESRTYFAPETVAAMPATRARVLEPVEIDADQFYTTKYGTPLAFVRVLELAGQHGFDDLEGTRVLDFGYGSIGALRLLALSGADAVGVDVDTFLTALYANDTDQGALGEGHVTLVHGSWPGREAVAARVGGGFDLIVSKNTLKRGYIHPERDANPRQLVDLGVDDETFVRALFEALNPGGLIVIYNLSPARSAPDEPYRPWTDGRCPFPQQVWESAGFHLLAFDEDDTAFARRMGVALGWGEAGMDLENDLFGTYTIARRGAE